MNGCSPGAGNLNECQWKVCSFPVSARALEHDEKAQIQVFQEHDEKASVCYRYSTLK